MSELDILNVLAVELNLKVIQVKNTVELLDAGNTVPFISRYRKEITGSLDENQIRIIEDRMNYLRNLEARKAVILNMIFNLGAGGFSKFKKTHQLIEEGDFAEASIEMLDSRWSDMVGRRAIELSRQMDTGEWQD